jgi:hypothetical protein
VETRLAPLSAYARVSRQIPSRTLCGSCVAYFPTTSGLLERLVWQLPTELLNTGHAVYVYQPGELPARVYRVELQTGQRTLWKQLMPSDPAGVENIGPILLTPDAKTCVFGYHRMLADLYLVEGLK